MSPLRALTMIALMVAIAFVIVESVRGPGMAAWDWKGIWR